MRGWVALAVALVVAGVVVSGTLAYGVARFANYYAVSGGMAPTIPTGAAFLVDRFAYGGSAPARGDVIVFMPPVPSANPFYKRIVAIPGDHLAVHAGRTLVNGRAVREPFARDKTPYELDVHDYGITVDGERLQPGVAAIPPRSAWQSPDTVPAGCYVVLGDNRGESEDSHIFGFVCPGRPSPLRSDAPAIVGRAILPPYSTPSR